MYHRGYIFFNSRNNLFFIFVDVAFLFTHFLSKPQKEIVFFFLVELHLFLFNNFIQPVVQYPYFHYFLGLSCGQRGQQKSTA